METEKVIERLETYQKQIHEAWGTYKSYEEKHSLTAEILTSLQVTVDGSWKAYQDEHLSLLTLTKREERHEIPHFRENRHDTCEDLYLELAADIADSLLLISRKTRTEPTPLTTAQPMMTKFQIEVELPPLSEIISNTHSEPHAKIVCRLCRNDHIITHCTRFGRMNPESRCEYAKQMRLCFNCLQPGHHVHYCKRRKACKLCTKRHHTLLHHQRKGMREEPHNRDREAAYIHAEVSFAAQTVSVQEREESKYTTAPHFTEEMRETDTQHRSEAYGRAVQTHYIRVGSQDKSKDENNAADKEKNNLTRVCNTNAYKDVNENKYKNTNTNIPDKWPFDPLGGKCVREKISWIEGQIDQRERVDTERVHRQITVQVLEDNTKYDVNTSMIPKIDRMLAPERRIYFRTNEMNKKLEEDVDRPTQRKHNKRKFNLDKEEQNESTERNNKTDDKKADENETSEEPDETSKDDSIKVAEKIEEKQKQTMMNSDMKNVHSQSLFNEDEHEQEDNDEHNEQEKRNVVEMRRADSESSKNKDLKGRTIKGTQHHEIEKKHFISTKVETIDKEVETIHREQTVEEEQTEETCYSGELYLNMKNESIHNRIKSTKENSYRPEHKRPHAEKTTQTGKLAITKRPAHHGQEKYITETNRDISKRERKSVKETHQESLYGGLPLKLCHILRELRRLRRLKVPPDKANAALKS